MTKEITPVPADATAAVAWAIAQRPSKWELGEWLARIVPEGSWDEMDADVIADFIVGAAFRALDEEPPS